MSIIQRVNEYGFVQAFDEMDRGDNFSVAARRALFDYYDDMSQDTGEPVELDVIAICCDWSEYTLSELLDEYPQITEALGEPWDEHQWLDELRDQTQVIAVEHYGKENTYLVLSF